MFCSAIEGLDHLFPSLIHDSYSLFHCHVVSFNIVQGVEQYVITNQNLVWGQASGLILLIVVYCRRCC